MRNQKSVENTLAKEVGEKGRSRKKVVFESLLSIDVLDFPEMKKRDLEILFTELLSHATYLKKYIDALYPVLHWYLWKPIGGP